MKLFNWSTILTNFRGPPVVVVQGGKAATTKALSGLLHGDRKPRKVLGTLIHQHLRSLSPPSISLPRCVCEGPLMIMDERILLKVKAVWDGCALILIQSHKLTIYLWKRLGVVFPMILIGLVIYSSIQCACWSMSFGTTPQSSPSPGTNWPIWVGYDIL